MNKDSEFDGVIQSLVGFLNKFSDHIGKRLGELNNTLRDNGSLRQAVRSQDADALGVQLENKSEIKTLFNLMNTKVEKEIGLLIERNEIVINYTVPFLNIILDDLYSDNPPFTFSIMASQDKQFALFLKSKEPLAKLDQLSFVFENIYHKLEEIQKKLLTEAEWQLNFSGLGYFHASLSPAFVYYMMILYSLDKLNNNIQLDSIEQIQWGIESKDDGTKNIYDGVFFGDSIRDILFEKFGFQGIYFPIDSRGVDSEIIKLSKLGAQAHEEMISKKDFNYSLKKQLDYVERLLMITQTLPSSAIFHKHKSLGKLSIELQLKMNDLSRCDKMSAKAALAFKRDIESIQEAYDQAPLNELFDQTIMDVAQMWIDLSTIRILSVKDSEIEEIHDDTKRMILIKGRGYDTNKINCVFKKLTERSEEFIRLKKFERLDIMWMPYVSMIKTFLARVTATSIPVVGDDAKLQLNAITFLMINVLNFNNKGKMRQWQIDMFVLLSNTMKMLSQSMSSHSQHITITKSFANLSPTSTEFKSVCNIVGVDILKCFEKLVGQDNQFLYINRSAYAINVLYQKQKKQPEIIVESCSFFLEKLSECKASEIAKKNVRDNLEKIKQIMSKSAQQNKGNVISNIIDAPKK